MSNASESDKRINGGIKQNQFNRMLKNNKLFYQLLLIRNKILKLYVNSNSLRKDVKNSEHDVIVNQKHVHRISLRDMIWTIVNLLMFCCKIRVVCLDVITDGNLIVFHKECIFNIVYQSPKWDI